MTGDEALDLTAAFGRLAAEAGAREAWPSSDGAVLFVYQDTARLHDGSVLFTVKAPKGRAALRWNPLAPGAGEHHEGLAGSLSARGLTREQTARVGERIARFSSTRVSGRLRPFSVPRQENTSVEISERFAATALGAFFDDGGVRWGAFAYEGCSAPARDTLRLGFASEQARVEVEIRPLAQIPAEERSAWHPVPPLAARVAEDTRPPGRRSPEEAVESYVLYALTRSIARDTELTEALEPDVSEDEPAEAPPPASALEVPKTTKDLFDARDVAHPTAFFVEPLERSLGAMEAVTTLLDADPGVAVIGYAHPICMTKVPLVNHVDYVGGMWHRFAELPFTVPAKDVGTPRLREIDLVLGTADPIRERIKAALAREETRLLAFFSTCVADLVGLDVEGIIAEDNVRDVPVLVWTASPDEGLPLSRFWAQLFKVAERPGGPAKPGHVNLVGFAAEGSAPAREIAADLAAAGVTADGFVIPSFRTEHVARFAEASATIVNRDKIIVGEMREVREQWPELPVVEVDPPFGPTATAAFCRKSAAAAGAELDEERLAARWAPHEATWLALRRRAAEHEVAIIVHPWEIDYLTAPETIYGLPLVSLLSEMGFRVRVVVIPGSGGDGPALVQSVLAGLGGEAEGLSVVAGEQLEEPGDDAAASERLDAMLRALPSSLVFTELPPDQRILDAGRLSIHPRDFEPGFAGAVRTARRLVRLAESRFFACFGGAPAQRGLECT